jgi:hypothetical protein
MTSPDNEGSSAGQNAGETPLDRVGELLREREKYEQWIAALEAKKDRTAPGVYERVKGDYERRRNEVILEITGHASELRQALDQARERHARLSQQETSRREERAEAELRYHVGEYTDEQWRVLSSKTDTELAQLSEAREAAKRALAQLEDVVRLATPAESVAAVPSGAAAAAPAERGGPRPGSKEFDELAFLKSVVGPQKTRGTLPAPATDAAAQPAPVAASAPVREAERPRYATPVGQAPLRAPTPGAPQAAQAAAPVPQPPAAPRNTTPGLGQPSVSVADHQPAARPSPETGKVPAFLKDVPTEQVKTLRCHECGTMNYSTEWYCERCGGELAAM